MTGHPIATLALLLAVPGCITAFAQLKPARAVLVITLTATLLLPEAVSIEVPLFPPLNKHSIPTICMLVGALIVAKKQLAAAKVGRGWDLLVLGMLFAAAGTVITNGDALRYGRTLLPALGRSDFITSAIQIVLFHAGPFFLGRTLFRSAEDARATLVGLVVAVVAYSPLVVIELRLSPQWHHWIYGFAQHDFAQTVRDGGYRPMVFMEHGLALATLTAVASLAAWSLARGPRYLRALPPLAIALWLTLLLILLKSFGAILFGTLLLPVIWFLGPKAQARVAALIALLIVSYIALRMSGLFPAEDFVALIARINPGRSLSLGFRMWNEEMFIEKLSQRPLFGWGGWARGHIYDDFGRNISVLDGAWIGMSQYGVARLVLHFSLLLGPSIYAWATIDRVPSDDRRLLATLSLISILFAADLLPNGFFNQLPMFFSGVVAGLAVGMTSARSRSRDLGALIRSLEVLLSARRRATGAAQPARPTVSRVDFGRRSPD